MNADSVLRQDAKAQRTVAQCVPPAVFGDSPDAIPVFATAAHGAILVPMPTLENNATQLWLISQSGIVAEAERRLSVVEEMEAVVSANLQRATRLRQSILQKAFTGQLLLKDEA